MAATPGFDPSKPTYHISDPPRGANELSAEFNYTSEENMLGMTLDDGKAAAFSKVKQGLQADSISKKVDAWNLVHSDDVKTHATLSQAYQDCFAAWQGDDADTAQKTFGQVVKTAEVMPGYSKNMHTATKNILDAVNEAKGTSSEGKQHLGPVVNPFSSSDGGKDEAEWQKLCNKIQTQWSTMDQQVESQHKDAGVSPYKQLPPSRTGGSGVGGVGATRSSATPSHLSTTATHVPGVKHPNEVDNAPTEWPPTGTDGTTTTPSGWDPSNPGYTGAGAHGATSAHFTPSNLDGGSTLAGFDPGSSGSSIGGGAGSVGSGGFAGGGSGVPGGIGSGAGLSGAGLIGGSGAGRGASGTGGSGAEGAGAGAGGRGGTGMMAPMRGGGAGGGGDDERERSTWLSEDEDVWGDDDAPPSVIS